MTVVGGHGCGDLVYRNGRIPLAVRVVLWVALAIPCYWALRLGWADHLSMAADLYSRERAVRLAPESAVFEERLALRREELGGEALPMWQRASVLAPENPERLMQLAIRSEMAGDYRLSARSLLAAAARSRLYQVRYLLAQYYFRRQSAEGFWPWARAALETSYGDASPLFTLCWQMRPESRWLSEHVIPPRREIARQYLAFLSRTGRWHAADEQAHLVLRSAEAADRPGLLAYCDTLLVRGEARTAAGVWNALCARRLLHFEPVDAIAGKRITNGDFRQAPSEAGFDWRVYQIEGVHSEVAGGALRVRFSGRQPEQCPVVWQFVPTVRGESYRLFYDALDSSGAPAEGVGWEVWDGGPAGGSSGSASFVASKEVTRIAIVYRRPQGKARLEDTVSITHVRLEQGR